MRRGRANIRILRAVAAVAVPLALAGVRQARADERREPSFANSGPSPQNLHDRLGLGAGSGPAPGIVASPIGGLADAGGAAAQPGAQAGPPYDGPLQLAQLRRPPIPGRPPAEPAAPPAESPSSPAGPTTGPAAEGAGAAAGSAAGGAGEPRVMPTMPSEMDLRPARPPVTPQPPGYVGFAVPSPVAGGDFLPVPDRWRIGQPTGSATHEQGNVFNPYRQNVLKGDYPLPGTQDIFFILGITSDTILEARKTPIPSMVSSLNAGSFPFFGSGESQLATTSLIVSAELFKGNVAYQPKDWVLRATAVANVNYVHFNELSIVKPDFREGRDRTDEQVSFQELFAEKRLADLSANYDFVSVRGGIQGFTSDFRGFLFSDNEPGVRLFGNWDNNRWQYNLAFFNQVEKDTNSGLNEFNLRDQQIYIANLFRQDFFFPGYTALFSFHANRDHSGIQYDENGFLVRPQPIGTVLPKSKEVNAYYLGWGGDGHIGRLNITHQFYYAFGEEEFNAIAGQKTNISAQFFAIELSYDQDYIRYRASFEYASGDHNAQNGTATGFDSIFDNPNFAGGGLSYFTRQAIILTGAGTGLTGRFSTLPDLRTSKEQGQANFVNPGLLLFNVGVDVDITPKVKLITNASYLRFDDTSSIQLLLQDNKIGRDIGFDIGFGLEYRPLLNNNIIIAGGVSALFPGEGFADIYSNETFYSAFLSLTFTY